MNSSNGSLDATTHARVLADKVIPDAGLNALRTHQKPRAIILGGQPGAGKGGLANAARLELGYDAVTVDPDELRGYHPDVQKFRAAHPYTWSGLTQADAGHWADELRDAAVAGRKNFIFDTTLSNAPWTADLIRDLEAKGYEVEVRVVAAHKLESELGVDERFSKKLDEFGYGRYVPVGARDAICPSVPTSLDTIRARTDAPIRNVNREGTELWRGYCCA